MIKGHLSVKRLTGTLHAIVPDHAGFDCTAAFEFDDTRDDAGMREVEPLYQLMRFREHLPLL